LDVPPRFATIFQVNKAKHTAAVFNATVTFFNRGSPLDPRFLTLDHRSDAVLFSVGANASHGLRRTNEDKRRAVTVLLTDLEWAKWGDMKVAKHAAVSQPFVSSLRKELSLNGLMIPEERLVQRNRT
jgi:hypothetical protein